MQKHLSVLAVIVTALALPSIAFAQIEKGRFVVGGEIGYNKKLYPSSEYSSNSGSHHSGSDSRSFSSTINVAHMLSDKFEFGLFFSYGDNISSSKTEDWYMSQKNKLTNKSFGIGPLIRYYQPIIEKLYLFGQLQSGIYKSENLSSSNYYYKEQDTLHFNSVKQKYTSLSTDLSPGISYLPLKWLSFEVMLGGISWSQMTLSGESNATNFDFNLNLRSLYIGTRLFF